MGDLFKNTFNKFAKQATTLNRGINKVVGKDVFADVNQIEDARTFEPLESFPDYAEMEPPVWELRSGQEREFTLEGSVIHVDKNLDACLNYRQDFKTAARYYADRFKFRYKSCVNDFDSLIYYFEEIYLEGLKPMLERAYSLLLPFGVFTVNSGDFMQKHIETYKRAIQSYETMAGIERSRNEQAEQMGEVLGGSVRMQGGGFGFKGAMKGMAQAEAFNLGMGLLGKFAAQQSKMTQAQKAEVFSKFDEELFFDEVYTDYNDSFYTMVQTLSENGMLGGVTIFISREDETVYKNLQNPMFPKNMIPAGFAKLISTNPFIPKYYELMKQIMGNTPEVQKISEYFSE